MTLYLILGYLGNEVLTPHFVNYADWAVWAGITTIFILTFHYFCHYAFLNFDSVSKEHFKEIYRSMTMRNRRHFFTGIAGLGYFLFFGVILANMPTEQNVGEESDSIPLLLIMGMLLLSTLVKLKGISNILFEQSEATQGAGESLQPTRSVT